MPNNRQDIKRKLPEIIAGFVIILTFQYGSYNSRIIVGVLGYFWIVMVVVREIKELLKNKSSFISISPPKLVSYQNYSYQWLVGSYVIALLMIAFSIEQVLPLHDQFIKNGMLSDSEIISLFIGFLPGIFGTGILIINGHVKLIQYYKGKYEALKNGESNVHDSEANNH